MKSFEQIVTSQESLDAIPEDFKGRICIMFGKYSEPAIITKRYKERVSIYGTSNVIVYSDALVSAYDNSFVIAHDNSQVYSYDYAYIYAYDNSQVRAMGNSCIIANDYSKVIAENQSIIQANNYSIIEGYNTSTITENKSFMGNIFLYGNSRKISIPSNLQEYLKYNNIFSDGKKAIFYIPVKKGKNETYYDLFSKKIIYEIGKKTTLKENIELYSLNKAIDCSLTRKKVLILEAEVDIKNIINNDLIFETNKLKILRKMPLEECGMLGQFVFRMAE